MGRERTVVNRQRIVAALDEVWETLLTTADAFSGDDWRRQSILPGWTVADVYAHVVGTERLLCDEPAPAVSVDVSRFSHVKNDIAVFNEQWIEHYRSADKQTVLDDLREVVTRRRDALAAATDDDFAAPSLTPAGPDSYGRFMRIRVFDCWLHLLDVCDSLSLPSPSLHTVSARSAWDEAAKFLPYAIGKGGKAPAGSRVRLVLTGDHPFDDMVNVAVAERAEVVRKLDRDPDVTVTLPALQLLRLIGGRASADLSVVNVDGDQQLGEQLIAGLGVTI